MEAYITFAPIRTRKSFLIFVLLCLTIFLFSQARASEEIRVGMSAALSGLNAELGLGMKNGIELGFAEINARGGVKGKELRLICKDDMYEPLRAAQNMRQLIDDEQVVAILGNTGTPTAVLTVPIANENKMLMFGAYTGAGLLRKEPPDCCIYNYRASYKEETAMMIDYLLDRGIKPEEIAFFTQRDSYGDAGYKGAVEQLRKRGYSTPAYLVHGRYQRNTLNVEQALADVLMADIEPKAIIMVGSYAASAKFIKLAREDIPELLFLNISFTGSDSLLTELEEKGEGVIVTQMVPSMESELPIVKDYLQAIANAALLSRPGFISLEGYIVARIFIEAAKKTGGNINQVSLLKSIGELGLIDIGFKRPLMLNKKQRQASHTVWMTQIKGGRFVQIESRARD